MSQRAVRVNELLLRELSDLLHTDYRGEAVAITITEVDCAPDLRSARVYYSVLGDEETRRQAVDFFRRKGGALQSAVGRRVILKYLPQLAFIHDNSIERGTQVLELLDSLDIPEEEEGK